MNEAEADHLATIDWQRGAWSDKKGKYSRQHVLEVERYIDRAYGVLTAIEGGDCWISEVILHPKITLKAGYEMSADAITHVHEHCYIARSIKTKVTVRSA